MWLMGGRDELDWLAHMSHELKWLSGELTGTPLVARQLEWTPRVDVLDSRGAVIVRVELAGVRPDCIQAAYSEEKQTLTVRGQRGELIHVQNECVPMLLEIDSGHFAREIELPPIPISVRQARTIFRSGILTIVLPKLGNDDSFFSLEETSAPLPV
jgi:HSP20 family molecular chaperone IbpA